MGGSDVGADFWEGEGEYGHIFIDEDPPIYSIMGNPVTLKPNRCSKLINQTVCLRKHTSVI